MSTSSVTDARRRYLIAAALVVVAVALGAVFGVIVARAISGYDITRVSDPTGSTVTVGDRKMAVWVSPEDATTYCGATEDETGRTSFSTSLTASMTITDGGRTWTRVGLIDGAPGSTHTLSCSAESDLVIGYADNPRLVRYIVIGVVLGGTAALLVLSGFVLALVTALRKPSAAPPGTSTFHI